MADRRICDVPATKDPLSLSHEVVYGNISSKNSNLFSENYVYKVLCKMGE
jgi:hypothetical protein